jgi:hypothetical protein
MGRLTLLVGLLAVLACSSCAATAKPRSCPAIDWRWPQHVIEERQAWEQAVGPGFQFRDGASPHFL